MMTPDHFIEICKPYWDEEGMFAPFPNPTGKWSGGNMLLDGAKYYVILRKLGHQFSFKERRRFRIMVERCWHRRIVGLLDRNPGRPDAQAHDDYTGVAAAARTVDPYVACQIYFYGQKHSWCFNNQKPGDFSLRFWHGRFIGQVAHYYACAAIGNPKTGEVEMPIFRDLQAKANLIFSGHGKDASSVIQNWLRVDAFEDYSIYVCDRWHRDMMRSWGCMGRVMAAYHFEKHPFALALKGII